MIKDYFLLAINNLKRRKIRSYLTILGIFIGIAAVVSLITMGQGLKTAITGQFGELSLDRLTIQNKGTGFGPPGSTVIEKLNKNDLEIIENVRGIDIVVTRLIRIANLEYNKISGFTYITDIPEEKKSRDFIYNTFDLEAEKGRLLKDGDSGKVLLGSDFLKTQDFEKKLELGKKVKINGKDFEIIGFLKKSGSIQLNGVIFIMNDDAEEQLNSKDEYDLIVLQVRDKNRIEEVAKEIERKLRDARNEKIGEESFSVETPVQSIATVNDILNVINTVVAGIAMISLIVGGVGISNTMYTSVVERTKEIGIMKAIGAKNKDIMTIFLIESGMLGLIGGLVGASIGTFGTFGISKIINNLIGLNLFIVEINYALLVGAITFSFLIGIISGIFPARQASRLNVVDALRKK